MKHTEIEKSEIFIFDIPSIAMGGYALAFMFIGIIELSLGSFFESKEGSICHIPSLVGGATCVIVSLLIIGLIALYWKIIVQKRGIVFPALSGFGFLIAIVTVFSGCLVASELYVWILNLI